MIYSAQNPHEQPPTGIVVDGVTADLGDLVTVRADELFAEPPVKSGEWLGCVYRQVLAASAGAVIVDAGAPASSVRRARDKRWPKLKAVASLDLGAGSPGPSIIIVGQGSTRKNKRINYRRPFLSKGGTWLMRAIRILGYRAEDVYLTNAEGPHADWDQRLQALRDLHDDALWVAFGRKTEAKLANLGIDCIYCPDPSHFRRYKMSTDEGPERYASKIAERGVPEVQRPDADAHLVRLGEGDEIPMLAGYLTDRVVTSTHVPIPGERDQSRRGSADPAKMQKARHYFVSGIEKTVGGAAIRAGLSRDVCREVARAQDWKAERAAEQRRKHDELIRRTSDEDVKNFTDARAALWRIVKKASAKVEEALDNDDLDAKALQAFVTSAEKLESMTVSGAAREHTADINERPIADLVAEFNEALRAQGLAESDEDDDVNM